MLPRQQRQREKGKAKDERKRKKSGKSDHGRAEIEWQRRTFKRHRAQDERVEKISHD